MPGSNFTFTSGANTGLNFSSNNNDNEDKPQKSNIRMAGEVFSNQNDTSNSSNDAAGESTGAWWRNQYSDMMSGNGENSPSNSTGSSNSNSQGTNSNINYGKYDPNMGNNKNIDKNYAANQQIIANYNGKNANNSTANGAAYNADVMSGINYNKAVAENKSFDAIKATQASIGAGNDHGIHQDNLAPNSKDYYDYLDTYDGPKNYDQVVSMAKQNPEFGNGYGGQDLHDTWAQWNKDKMDYEAAWGSGQSVAKQKGWDDSGSYKVYK